MTPRLAIVLIACAALLAFPHARARAESPTERVRGILEEVMSVQESPEPGDPASRDRREAGIKRIIGENFDFDSMARSALGDHWARLTGTRQAEFLEIFRTLFQDSYTKLVLDFLKRERILYGAEERERDRALVRTTIVRPNESIPVHYSLARSKDRWLVEDVAIDGVSIVLNYRRSFSRVIQRESFPALLKRMRLQAQAIEKSPR